ncbi:hypothetical protein N7507_007199 [Penicillium longicatenatum]|nr:hypothetical protein N7507_007199 [Penicillium longicatenatum]
MAPRSQRNICNVCRARKVRCDRRQQTCRNCDRLGFICSYPTMEAPALPTSQLPRLRIERACIYCRSRKARCDGRIPVCARCRDLGKECVYPDVPRTHHRGPGSIPTIDQVPYIPCDDLQYTQKPAQAEHDASHLEQEKTVGLASAMSFRGRSEVDSNDEIQQTLTAFFQHVYPIPIFSFVHRTSLMQRHQAGMADEALILAITGLTALLTGKENQAQSAGTISVDRAESMVLQNLDHPTILTVQALVLVIGHHLFSHKLARAFVSGSAVGFA